MNRPQTQRLDSTWKRGHSPIEEQIRQLEKERDNLVQKKKGFEYELAEIEQWKRVETSKILARRFGKTTSIQKTTELEAHAHAKKAPMIRELQAIEKRLHEIRGRLSDKRPAVEKSDTEVLLRIEQLLIQLIERLDRQS